MTCGAPREFFSCANAYHYIGTCTHRTSNEYGLTGLLENFGKFLSAWTKGPCCTLSVYIQGFYFAIYFVFLYLARVVAYIIQGGQLGTGHDLFENRSHQVGYYLPVS